MAKPIRLYAGVAVLLIAGLVYSWGDAQPPAQSKAGTPLVEFTGEGKLKRPIGYRNWVYIGTPLTPNDLNDGEAAVPGVPRCLSRPRELRPLRENRASSATVPS